MEEERTGISSSSSVEYSDTFLLKITSAPKPSDLNKLLKRYLFVLIRRAERSKHLIKNVCLIFKGFGQRYFGKGGESIDVHVNISELERRDGSKGEEARKRRRLIRGENNIAIISHDISK